MSSRYFLSASIPDPRREPIYYDTADLTAIREAIMALATVALKRGQLVFGGHPAISPMVLLIAEVLNRTDRVQIFQSEFFRRQIPAENVAFGKIVWTPMVGADEGASLRAMRNAMIGSEPFAAGFFIGGMEGVEEEFELFRTRWPGLPAFPVGSTGAAARRLLARSGPQLPFLSADQMTDLQDDVVYSELFERLLGEGHAAT